LLRFGDVRPPLLLRDEIFLLDLLDGADFMPVVTVHITDV
jgi:hypothetical protein